MGASDPAGGGAARARGAEPCRRAEPWWNDSLLVTFAFRCNLACTFCMVEDALGAYEGTSLEAFRELSADPAALRGARRIIFSGGEVTLAKDLLDYVALARSLPGVEHVRVQTNGIRLGDPEYLRALLDAGVDELFISLHAPEAELCDAITRRRGSFEGILAGMRAVARSGAALFTNTAIVQANHRVLPEIVEVVAPLGPRSMEFWNYWPRGDEGGARRMNARVIDSQGPLLAALAACVRRGIPPVVKWYPRCLLGEYAPFHDDGQPPSIIEDRYWDREPGYGCIFDGVCLDAPARPGGSTAGACAGLSDAYVRELGWEEGVLRPRRAPREGEPGIPVEPVGRSLVADAGARRTEQAIVSAFLSRIGLEVGMRIEGWELAVATRARSHEGGRAVALTFMQGGRAVAVRLHDTDPARRCALRTRSFDVSYRLEGPASASDDSAPALLRALLTALRERDPGGLRAP
jgi:cyclic pyranopterin phosphate synthase